LNLNLSNNLENKCMIIFGINKEYLFLINGGQK